LVSIAAVLTAKAKDLSVNQGNLLIDLSGLLNRSAESSYHVRFMTRLPNELQPRGVNAAIKRIRNE
jgi:hypothetical protein